MSMAVIFSAVSLQYTALWCVRQHSRERGKKGCHSYQISFLVEKKNNVRLFYFFWKIIIFQKLHFWFKRLWIQLLSEPHHHRPTVAYLLKSQQITPSGHGPIYLYSYNSMMESLFIFKKLVWGRFFYLCPTHLELNMVFWRSTEFCIEETMTLAEKFTWKS